MIGAMMAPDPSLMEIRPADPRMRLWLALVLANLARLIAPPVGP